MYLLQPLSARLRHVVGTDQHQGDKFVVPGLCGADVEVHQAVNQGGKRYIAHIVQTWYEANKNKGIMFRMQDWVESGKNGEHWEQFYQTGLSKHSYFRQRWRCPCIRMLGQR